VAGVTLAGCGGDSLKSAGANGGGAAAGSNSLAAFCKDNAQAPSISANPSPAEEALAAAIIQRMLNEAPAILPASVKAEMTQLQADLVALSKGQTLPDSQSALVTASQDVGNWMTANCGGGSAGTTTSTPSSTPATTPDTAGSSAATDLAAFCADLNSAVKTIGQATDPLSANAPASKSDLEQWGTTVATLITESSRSGISGAFGGDPAVMTPLTNGLNSLSQALTSAAANGVGVDQVHADATLLQGWVTSNCGPNYSGG
jgi:hypothetical protein